MMCQIKRGRKIVPLLAIGILLSGIAAEADTKLNGNAESASEWEQRAEEAQDGFFQKYWSEERSMFNNRHPCNNCNRTFNYWWQAHAIDVLVDGFERTGEQAYLDRAEKLYEGIVERNNGITIDYYDDMLWMALALLRVYQHTDNDTYKDAVLELWEDTKTGWTDAFGGGIAWRKSQLDYKNTPSNAPAVILAARLHREFGDESDLEWAERIYSWLQETLIDPETGFAWDGVNRTGNEAIDKRWRFTYNQGVYIGASLELYEITGRSAYIDEAHRTAEAATDELVIADHGLLKREGTGDGGLFKGILVRYLGDLIRHAPDESSEYIEMLEHNASIMWNRAREDGHLLFAPLWNETVDGDLDLSVHLSGLKLLEQVANLTKGPQ